MGGGGSKSTSISYSGSSNPAFVPYALQGVNTVNSVYNKAAPGLDLLNKNLTDTIIPGLQSKAQGSAGVAGLGNQYNSDVLSGKYLNGNPYLQNMIDQIGENVGNQVGGHFSASGRYGSGANQAVMAKQLANQEGQLRFQDYNAERDRMGAAQQAGQAGSTQDIAALLGAIQQGATQPYAGSESLANSLGALFAGGQDKSTSKQGSNLFGSILGAAATLGAAAISDRRLKTNIVRIGEWDDRGDGLGKYEWNWKAAPNGKKETGVIADEVERLRPKAHVPNFVGQYAGVNYAMLSAA